MVDHDKESGITKIHSSPVIDQMLNTFSMTDFRIVYNTLPRVINLDSTMVPKTEQERMDMEGTPYRERIEALLHLQNTTCPYIAFVVGFFVKVTGKP